MSVIRETAVYKSVIELYVDVPVYKLHEHVLSIQVITNVVGFNLKQILLLAQL